MDGNILDMNRMMRRRQNNFREAAKYVASAFAAVAGVEKVALFGSVGAPHNKHAARFRRLRRAGIDILHECRDVDIVAWVSDLGCLRNLQKARSRALNDLLSDRNIGVAHHQVDVFIMEPESDRYLGRLCRFSECPKGKDECRVSGCGTTPFLQRHERFVFNFKSLESERVAVLYERSTYPVGAPAKGERSS